jgi:DNA repair protein RecN (Recombination protein N)
MIAELRVRDLATIADVTLQLGSGLNVLTGETGAGKSMLVDALSLLLGGRAESGLVRPGAARAIVECVLDVQPSVRRRIEALGLDAEDDRLIIRREITAEGRSRAWVNGSPTTAGVLSELGAELVELHGQFETQSLLKGAEQRELLDAFAEAGADRTAVAEAHAVVAALAAEEAQLAQRRDDVKRRADYLRHVVQEIDAAKLVDGEWESLEIEGRRLAQAGALAQHAERISELLDGTEESALSRLAAAEKSLAALERIDPAVAEWRTLADTAYANLRELAANASAFAQGVSEDPARLEIVERRRDKLSRLMQKYGEDLPAVKQLRDESATQLDALDTADLDLKSVAARRAVARTALDAAAAVLTARRTASADRFARAVNRLLPKLGLTGGQLTVQLEPLPEPGAAGAEQVTLLARLNVGHEARPIAKAASGGELARLMLALKVVLARHDRVPTLVFDEIDAGIGGEVGGQVGEALADVATRHQVLVITHLPQIAARADRHLVVSKRAKAGVATSDVAQIHGEDRVTEIARMLGDGEGDAARRHAESLLRGPATRAAKA